MPVSELLSVCNRVLHLHELFRSITCHFSCLLPKGFLLLQSKAFPGLPKSAHSYESKPWGETLPWDRVSSPVSQEIQRSELARAQLLSTGGSFSLEAQNPAASRSDKKGYVEAVKQREPTEVVSPEPAVAAAAETPAVGDRAAASGAGIAAKEAPSVDHRQNNAAHGGPGSYPEAASETPPVSKAVFARQLGDGGQSFPTPKVPSSVKNPLFEASSSASIGSSSTGGASVRQLGFQASGINPIFENLKAQSPGAGTKSSASFRSAIRRAAHRSKQGKQDSLEAEISPQQGLASNRHRRRRQPQDQQALEEASRQAQKQLLGREGTKTAKILTQQKGDDTSELLKEVPERSISSLSSPSPHAESTERGRTSRAKTAISAENMNDQSRAEAGARNVTPQGAGMDPIWKLWNSGKAATESLQHENRKSTASRADNKSVRCSLLDSMNSVSDEFR